MRRSFLRAFMMILLLPAAAAAEPLLMQVQLALAPLPRVLFVGVRLWVLFFLGLTLRKLWRVVRGPTRETHPPRREALMQLARLLLWGAAPAIVVGYLLNRPAMADQAPSLLIGLIWAALFLPGLLVPPDHRASRWLRLAALVAGDLGGASLLLWQAIRQNRELAVWPLAIFLLVLHLAVMSGVVSHGRRYLLTRWVGLLALLFLTAQFFTPAAQVADREALTQVAVSRAPVDRGPVRAALFEASGRSALVCFERESQRLYQVSIPEGHAQLFFASMETRFTRLAMDPDRRLLVAAADSGGEKRVFLFNATPFVMRGAFDSSERFSATALAVSAANLGLGATGATANFRLCPIKNNAGPWSIAQACRNLKLFSGEHETLSRIGAVMLAADRGWAIVAEGGYGFVDGWRLASVSLLDGSVMRTTLVGRTLGGLAYDPAVYSFYVARPAQGRIDMYVLEGLKYNYSIPAEPGVEFLAVDGPRRWLLAASPQTGRLIVYDLQRKKVMARAPIGSGLVQLDYHQPTATALLSTARGLILVRVDELPGLEER